MEVRFAQRANGRQLGDFGLRSGLGTIDVMATLKGPSEGGSGGKRGHRNMEHWGFNGEVKEAARSRRRLDDRYLSTGDAESGGWMPLSGKRARGFEEEAGAEIGSGHDLAGVDLKAVSTCPGCDAVLFRLSDSSLAVVYLTWSGVSPWGQPGSSRERPRVRC